MNHKYRKKPVVIEAFQMTRERRWDNSDWPNWLHRAWNREHDEPNCFFSDPGDSDELFIMTLEGTHQVTFEDWIIQGVAGELYPCKPEIFEATYEAVEV